MSAAARADPLTLGRVERPRRPRPCAISSGVTTAATILRRCEFQPPVAASGVVEGDLSLTLFAFTSQASSTSVEALAPGPKLTQKRGNVQITKNSLEEQGLAERLVHRLRLIDPVATPGPVPYKRQQGPLHAGRTHAWHTHPHGQTIFVIEGIGLAQRRGGPIEVIRPGDRVFFEPGEEHWHGAAATAS